MITNDDIWNFVGFCLTSSCTVANLTFDQFKLLFRAGYAFTF